MMETLLSRSPLFACPLDLFWSKGCTPRYHLGVRTPSRYNLTPQFWERVVGTFGYEAMMPTRIPLTLRSRASFCLPHRSFNFSSIIPLSPVGALLTSA